MNAMAINQTKQERNCAVDELKALCAFFVICIHAPFPGIIGEYITVWARVAVPVFFMISGFFYRDTHYKRTIKKLINYFVWATLIYLLSGIVQAVFRKEVGTWILNVFSWKTLFSFLLFYNGPHVKTTSKK